MATLEEIFQELTDKYHEGDEEPMEFLYQEPVPEGLTYGDAFDLFIELVHKGDSADFFIAEDGNEEGTLWVKNLNTEKELILDFDTLYPPTLK